LYHTQVFQSMIVLVVVCVLCPVLCICLAMGLFCRRWFHSCCGDYVLLTDEEPPDEAESGGATHQPKVTKYGFGDGDGAVPVETPPEGDAQDRQHAKTPEGKCALCMSALANVVFLPCYHCYCCSACSVQLERHAGAERTEALTCPFCRQPIETMVNLNKVYKSADPPAAGASSSSNPPTSSPVGPRSAETSEHQKVSAPSSAPEGSVLDPAPPDPATPSPAPD